MVSQNLNVAAPLQRLTVDMETHESGNRVKIRVESYDEFLGWYTSGSLELSLHQLPLLEQAMAEMRASRLCGETLAEKIIALPGLTRQ